MKPVTITLRVDAMPMLRVSAKLKVELEFNRRAAELLHRDHAYRRKREAANAVMRSEKLDETHPFAREARMRGLTVRQLADIVAAKPDTIYEREIERVELIKAIDDATTPDELKKILGKIGH